MMHFYEKLERKIDFSKEYLKIEKIVCNENYLSSDVYGHYVTLDKWIEENFSKWKNRKNYTSFAEVREQCGFSVEHKKDQLLFRSKVSMEDYFLYAEMLSNLVIDLVMVSSSEMSRDLSKRFSFVLSTIKEVVEICGYELVDNGGTKMIILKNPAAIEVADKNPELAEVIVEYNHYLLKGNLDKKQDILMKIARALEPKKDVLNQIDKNKTTDFFYLVNEMNIRHNNIESGTKNYSPAFDTLSANDKETYYDLIYEQALLLYMLLGQLERNKLIETYKENSKAYKE